MTSTLIGATKLDQLEANARALEVEIPPALSAKLEEASRPDEVFPYVFFGPTMRGMLTGGTKVRAEQPWNRA